MESLNHVSDSNFESEVIKSTEPVLIDFWAPWCGPCKMLAPVVEKIAEKYKGRLKVLKMNTDENPKTPSSFSITGIPTLILFKSGKQQAKIVGFRTQEQIEKEIENLL